MIDFVEYLKAKLEELSDSTYSIGVYDEVNYNFENPEDIVFIYSGNTVVQADYSKKTYTQSFSLSVYTEKDGFDYANNLAFNLFKSVNNTTTTINGYVTRIEIESPVVLNVYGALQNGLNNTLQLTGVLHLTFVGELGLDNKYFIDDIEVSPINPILNMSMNSNTENKNGIGETHVNFYTYEFNFSIWDDDSEFTLSLKNQLMGTPTTHDLRIKRGRESSISLNFDLQMLMHSQTFLDNYMNSAIKNTSQSAILYTRNWEGHGTSIVYYNGVEQTSDDVSIPTGYWLKCIGKEEIYGSTELIFYFEIVPNYKATNILIEDMNAIITYATDTQSGLSTYNVKMVK